jgi:hypothetical protein
MCTRPRFRLLAGAGLLVAGTALAGCGGDSDEGRDPDSSGAPAEAASAPDEETAACRSAWSELGDDAGAARAEATGAVDQDGEAPPPSALTSRWTSVEATVEYYVGSATSDDCGETLADQEAAIAALSDFGEELRRFDMQRQLAELDADDDRRATRQALRTLVEQAPRATEDQAAAWEQAAVVELDDARARRQAIDDLQLLSEESRAWRRSEQAVRLLERRPGD